MTNDERGRTSHEQRSTRRYMWEIGAGAIAFLVLFLFLPPLIPTESGSPASIVIALVPLLPVAWIVIAVASYIRRLDELHRPLALQSLALGFGAAMLIALTVAFLSTADITVLYPEWWVFIGGMSVFGVSFALLTARASR